jgi:hypothetical protein
MIGNLKEKVMTQRSSTTVALAAFCILALVFVPFLARPVTAASQPGALDVVGIDAFVREQVQRHGIPGLGLTRFHGSYAGRVKRLDRRNCCPIRAWRS